MVELQKYLNQYLKIIYLKKNNKSKKDKFSTISISDSFINDEFIKNIIYLEKNSSNHIARLKKFNHDEINKLLIDNDIRLQNNN